MRLELLKNIKENETLAKSIVDNNGKVLLKSGTKLTHNFILHLLNYGVFFVYVEDENFEDIYEDKYLSELKQTTLELLPNIFNDLLNDNGKNALDSLKTVEELINYVIKDGNVNTNLYEVKTYDNYTYIHCVDTCIMSIFLGTSLKFNYNDIKDLGLGALLHDIGKIKISNSIINKTSSLTEDEFDIIKHHPLLGKEILINTGIVKNSILDGVSQHHEKVDGTGYPYGLKENEISKQSKVISVCDVFTALSANRSYRNRYDPNEAYEHILSHCNTHFNKSVVEKFKETFAIYPLGSRVKLSNGIEGYVVKQNRFFPDRPIVRIVYGKNINDKIPFYEINLLEHNNLVIKSLVV